MVDDEKVKRSKGSVVWFSKQRGFGFICDDEQGDDVFVHYSKIQAPEGEYKILNTADKVEFERFDADRGENRKPQAKNVRKIT